MKKTDINPLPEYFDRYINLVKEPDLMDALQNSLLALQTFDTNRLEKIGDKVYAPGKWTVKDILQHIIDTERVFCYRSLRFARADRTALPGYDENAYAVAACATKRPLEKILQELIGVRKSTIDLFNSFDEHTLLNKGITWKYEMSVLAMGFTISGHEIHHLNVIREKYDSLV
jgi:hypothetical protein